MDFISGNQPNLAAPDRPQVSVFCAVWHKQPDKLELLRSHRENLRAQSIAVEPCYIFDNGDEPPAWLDAPWHSFAQPLTIYEAWAAGAALSHTRYVMNLNMDDRLATGAARALLGMAQATGAALVGGEWDIRFDTNHLTENFDVSDLYESQFAPDWPPKPLDGLRLGSGTGERGTYGPSTLWDVSQTGKPYPTHFGNGEPIKSIGDAIFWELIRAKELKLARLPMVIGRYYSASDAQAEFRPHADGENLRNHGLRPLSFGQEVLAHLAQQGTSPRNKVEETAQTLSEAYTRLFQPVAAE